MRFVLAGFTVLVVTLGLRAPVSAAQSPDCIVVGQLLSASDYAGVRITRDGTATYANFRNMLCAGDILTIQDDVTATVVDTSKVAYDLGTGSHRIEPFGDGARPAESKSDLQFWRIVKALLSENFIARQPSLPTTLEPREDPLDALGGCPSPSPVMLGRQRVPAVTRHLAMLWEGCARRIVLSDPSGEILEDVTIDLEEAERLRAIVLSLPADWARGRTVAELWLTGNGRDWMKIDIVVAELSAVPKPPGTNLDWSDMNNTKRALSAIWLAVQGSSEWQLYGWTLVAEFVDQNYLAWKAWGQARAGKAL